MSSLYKRIKNLIVKPVLYTGLVAIALTGCGKSGEKIKEVLKNPNPTGVTCFDNWGIIDKLYTDRNTPLDIELGDMDGDGDLDIVFSQTGYNLKIYENRIPRK